MDFISLNCLFELKIGMQLPYNINFAYSQELFCEHQLCSKNRKSRKSLSKMTPKWAYTTRPKSGAKDSKKIFEFFSVLFTHQRKIPDRSLRGFFLHFTPRAPHLKLLKIRKFCKTRSLRHFMCFLHVACRFHALWRAKSIYNSFGTFSAHFRSISAHFHLVPECTKLAEMSRNVPKILRIDVTRQTTWKGCATCIKHMKCRRERSLQSCHIFQQFLVV